MVVDGGQVDAGFSGDGAEGTYCETIAGEETFGGVEDSILRVHTFVLIIRMNKKLSSPVL
jgi:hypothetical protein